MKIGIGTRIWLGIWAGILMSSSGAAQGNLTAFSGEILISVVLLVFAFGLPTPKIQRTHNGPQSLSPSFDLVAFLPPVTSAPLLDPSGNGAFYCLSYA